MNKRGGWAIWVSIGLLVVFVFLTFYYFISYSSFRNGPLIVVVDPTDGLSDEQAEVAFNESFVSYLLYNIGAYNLHNPPLSGDKPLIWVIVGEDSYNAVVDGEGNIVVQKGDPHEADVVIKTTKKEAIKMIRNKDYIKDSFAAGLSSIDLLAGKTTLFAKGYFNIYNNLNGAGATGNVIKIYTS